MQVHGTAYRTIWVDAEGRLKVINQQLLPHRFAIVELASLTAVCDAIRDMTVRGAGLIGATAGYGVWLAACNAPTHSVAAFESALLEAATALRATRPTARNLAWAVERQLAAVQQVPDIAGKIACTRQTAQA
ncbi:MAG: S-methyl-5-thioribose-1-phosphate isomerase, partial [Bilophila sp.]